MANCFPTGSAAVPDTAHYAGTQRDVGTTTVCAQNGSVVNSPHFNDVHAARDANLTVTVNNTYVQSFARTDETNGCSPNLQGNIQRCQTELKDYLQNKTEDLFQGTKEDGSSILLDQIYTELYITEGGSGQVNSEHEVIELECTKCTGEERKIHLNDIFEALSKEGNPPRRVLTKGIAGIGKTVAVQKFTHDWAKGRVNQKFQCIFPFTFRDLNLIKDKLNLMELICHYYEEATDLETSDYKNSRILFIFDGLDESQLPLEFENNEMCRSLTKKTSVDAILTNLIEGNLLHKASIWITSRPAAASKIPPKFINRVTEVRGFNDEQKDEYFKKKISDRDIAQRIFDHLQSKPLRSLYIMCHIPVFCWISATVLQDLLTHTPETELPKSVTEMYTHFLIIQTKRKHEKDYQDGDKDKDVIMKLGKLAFEQLQKGNIIFCDTDLKDCNIDLKQAAIYSGVCTEIIRKEYGLHRQVSYSFIHLSVQEFLAALYVLENFVICGKNLLAGQRSIKVASEKGEIPIILLHKSAVDKALATKHGQWDLFLRFLLGLSLDTNQKLLQKLVGFEGRHLKNSQETIEYINKMIKKLTFYEKSIYLFHCLNELGDKSLVEQVQKYHSSGDVNKISPAHWSALAYVLLVSNENLDIFDLKKFSTADEVLERMMPLLKVSKTALLGDCNLTDRCCSCISSVLSLKASGLEELDLSKNKLQDYGMELLSAGLKSPNCQLQKLSLRDCNINKEGCWSLASALVSNPSHLRELDLSQNKIHLLDSPSSEHITPPLKEGLKPVHPVLDPHKNNVYNDALKASLFVDDDQELDPLSEVLKKCSLETLRLCGCGITEKPLKCLVSALSSNPSHLKNLDLSRNSFGSQSFSLLLDFLKHPDCQLQTLCLFKANLKLEDAAALASALKLSHLRELDLGGNVLGDAGVIEIAALLKDPNCKVATLRLAGCRFTESGCAALASSLKSNPAHLRVLDLTRNFFKDAGVENLSDFLAEPLCQLKTLNLQMCSLTTACCRILSLALSCCSALKELDLSYNQLMDEGVKLLCGWLQKPQCKLEILRLSCCTESSCEALASALTSNPSHLRELELSKMITKESHLKLRSDLQINPQYKVTVIEG
ncbi:NLR family CARD domain-containing protein 3 CARD15-like protein Caterpiller protein 16.2 [Channa argus]|uniref:NLR family CARD domain-containing protein 3 CARD15-like protein Caterpiller protein 16.2 n=1 Tax=Channa argus TaxID=215402 RepID=A0A6G1PCX9_CHAAH|nr:NLR family CARD domain-containing protein 3 CARD15-like protein Caterpiller protein 16.2 [Channa argus]